MCLLRFVLFVLNVGFGCLDLWEYLGASFLRNWFRVLFGVGMRQNVGDFGVFLLCV